MVVALVPSLSRSLAEQFNVFRVMHHGTHEKQMSNVFAWLFNSEGTHQLGSAAQRLFVAAVNRGLPADAAPLPADGYDITQEVDTAGAAGEGKDIADIILTSPSARIVVENYEFPDGHGHDYWGYLAHAEHHPQRVVVMLCVRRLPDLRADGWEDAVVVTYPELLHSLAAHIADNPAWQRSHPRQNTFINELVQHFSEGQAVVSDDDQIAFIKAMCDTGESARYGQRPQDAAAEEFATLLGQHARRQFQDSRGTLNQVKQALRRYAARTLVDPVNEALASGLVEAVATPFQGQWEWSVMLRRADPRPNIYLEYGPTAVAENRRVTHPVVNPDYTKVFVTRQAIGPDGNVSDGIDRIIQTDVGLDEVLAGLTEHDERLRDDVLAILDDS